MSLGLIPRPARRSENISGLRRSPRETPTERVCMNTENLIVPALQFFHENRALFTSDIAGYNALAGPLRECVVSIGRKKFIDLAKWRAFVQRGGQTLPGGYRKVAA